MLAGTQAGVNTDWGMGLEKASRLHTSACYAVGRHRYCSQSKALAPVQELLGNNTWLLAAQQAATCLAPVVVPNNLHGMGLVKGGPRPCTPGGQQQLPLRVRQTRGGPCPHQAAHVIGLFSLCTTTAHWRGLLRAAGSASLNPLIALHNPHPPDEISGCGIQHPLPSQLPCNARTWFCVNPIRVVQPKLAGVAVQLEATHDRAMIPVQ